MEIEREREEESEEKRREWEGRGGAYPAISDGCAVLEVERSQPLSPAASYPHREYGLLIIRSQAQHAMSPLTLGLGYPLPLCWCWWWLMANFLPFFIHLPGRHAPPTRQLTGTHRDHYCNFNRIGVRRPVRIFQRQDPRVLDLFVSENHVFSWRRATDRPDNATSSTPSFWRSVDRSIYGACAGALVIVLALGTDICYIDRACKL